VEGLSLKDRLAQIERSFIEQALQQSEGNVSKTAKLLNVQRTTLIEKINKYELRSA
jgi:sigma-54 specific flagellar transcriptional regulator A